MRVPTSLLAGFNRAHPPSLLTPHVEVTLGLEPRTQGFADLRLTIRLCYHIIYIGRDARLPIRLSSWIQQISDPCSFTIRYNTQCIYGAKPETWTRNPLLVRQVRSPVTLTSQNYRLKKRRAFIYRHSTIISLTYFFKIFNLFFWLLVVSVGLEPTTPALSAQCSNQLSYETIYKSYPTFAIGQMSDMEYFVSTLRNKATNQRPTFIAAYIRYRILYLSFFRRDTSTLTTMSRGVCHHIYWRLLLSQGLPT